MKEQKINLLIMPEDKLELLLKGVAQIQEQLEGMKGNHQQTKGFYTSSEARKILGISQKTWQTYRDERRIPFSQFGRKIYVKKSDLDDFMESHKINPRN